MQFKFILVAFSHMMLC